VRLANEGEFVRPFFVSTRERSSAARALWNYLSRRVFDLIFFMCGCASCSFYTP